MKKHILLFLSLFTVVVLSIGISSCGDDPPPTNPKLSMAVDEKTVNEDDGTIEIEMVLDKAASSDLIIEYEIDGSADEGSTATSDYEIQGDVGEVKFEQGQTSAIIEIEINNDNLFEGDETIQLRIQDANTDKVDITNLDETEITIIDDDSQPTVNFEETTLNVNEDDGMLEIRVKLSSAAAEDITVQYDLSGTAIDSLTAWEDEIGSDYYIDGVSGEVEIAQGETIGIIRLQLYTDLAFEDGNGATAGLGAETIIISLKSGASAEVGDDGELQINVAQQDGRLVILNWGVASTDLDLIVWMGEDESDMFLLTASLFNRPEFVFIPKNLAELFEMDNNDAVYGMSYLYYDGTTSPLDFEVRFVDVINGAVEAEANWNIYEATYTQANLNTWPEESEELPIIAQTFDQVNGGNFTTPTPETIEIPASGSRVKTPRLTIPSGVKINRSINKPLKRLFY